MQANFERRNGSDRRQPGRSSMAAIGLGLRWNDLVVTTLDDEPYDPYDPYWEPVKGQDDD